MARLHILKQREYKMQVCNSQSSNKMETLSPQECQNGGAGLPGLNSAWQSPNAPSINGETVYGTGIGQNLPDSATESARYSYPVLTCSTQN